MVIIIGRGQRAVLTSNFFIIKPFIVFEDTETNFPHFLYFVQSGSLYAVHTLSEYGANMKTEDLYGRTLMHHAASIGAV